MTHLKSGRLALASALCWVTGVALLGAAEPKKPNIILIMADDVNYDAFGCYGSEYFATPRLDQLAATGVKFTHCYSEPVCTPSRVKIMTGRDGIRNYVRFGHLDPSEKTFGTMMQEAGYATAVAGKWQLQGKSDKPGVLAPAAGFDTYCLWNYPGSDHSQRYWNPSLIRDGQPVKADENAYGPDICTDFLIDFIKEKRDKPFFVYYPSILAHSPFLPTPDSKDRGSTDELQNFRDMVQYLDKSVGRIVDALEASGQRENTVIIFTTDNGSSRKLNYPFRGEERAGEKGFSRDGGYHAPLIVNMPGTVPAGKVDESLVDFSDFLPTIAQISGAALPKVTLDGRSFWPQCLGEKGDPREWVFQFYYPQNQKLAEGRGLGINNRELTWAHTDRYKLYRNGSLYELADRAETTPIAVGEGSPEAEAARKFLQGVLDQMPSKPERLDPKDKSKDE